MSQFILIRTSFRLVVQGNAPESFPAGHGQSGDHCIAAHRQICYWCRLPFATQRTPAGSLSHEGRLAGQGLPELARLVLPWGASPAVVRSGKPVTNHVSTTLSDVMSVHSEEKVYGDASPSSGCGPPPSEGGRPATEPVRAGGQYLLGEERVTVRAGHRRHGASRSDPAQSPPARPGRPPDRSQACGRRGGTAGRGRTSPTPRHHTRRTSHHTRLPPRRSRTPTLRVAPAALQAAGRHGPPVGSTVQANGRDASTFAVPRPRRTARVGGVTNGPHQQARRSSTARPRERGAIRQR